DDGSFEYTPPANYYGEVTFRYKLIDDSGLSSNIATVTITVVNTGGEIYLPLIFR
ncbi:MAG: Ig-like domain-containing protein, partial [Syntrophomonadaceae bacterium]